MHRRDGAAGASRTLISSFAFTPQSLSLSPYGRRRAREALAAELHSDEEAALLDVGSRQRDLWGINLYPADYGTEGWIEFDSMINVRPSPGNRSRSVEDPALRDRIVAIVNRLVRT